MRSRHCLSVRPCQGTHIAPGQGHGEGAWRCCSRSHQYVWHTRVDLSIYHEFTSTIRRHAHLGVKVPDELHVFCACTTHEEIHQLLVKSLIKTDSSSLYNSFTNKLIPEHITAACPCADAYMLVIGRPALSRSEFSERDATTQQGISDM